MRGKLPLAATVLVMVLAACSADSAVEPTFAEMDPSLHRSGGKGHGGASCNVGNARKYANRFFSSHRDPVYDLIAAMGNGNQGDHGKGGKNGKKGKKQEDSMNDRGFDVLREIASARGTKRQKGDGEDAAALSLAILSCMDVGPLPRAQELAAAVDGGIFEVRGGKKDGRTPAIAFRAAPGRRTPTSTIWGMEASSGWSASYNRQSSRYLIHARPVPVASFTNEHATRDEANVAYTGFDVNTVPVTPKLSFDAPLRSGICVEPQEGNLSNRLLHGDEGEVILALSPLTFCEDDVAARLNDSRLMQFARRGLAMLAPDVARARAIGGVGGLPSNLSPFGSVVVDVGSGSRVSVLAQPSAKGSRHETKVKAGKKFPVAVRVTTDRGTPIEGVSVSLSIVKDRHTPHGAALKGHTVALTDTDGVARFNVSIQKAGSYRLAVVPTLGGASGKKTYLESFTVKR